MRGLRSCLLSFGNLCYNYLMNIQDALATLRQHENDLRERGIRHAAVFGSVARGDNRPDSDLDILLAASQTS